MGIRMSQYHLLPRIRLAPANGDSAYCYVCEREGDRNDVFGYEYGHLRLIDLCIAIEGEREGERQKKRQRKVFWEIPPLL